MTADEHKAPLFPCSKLYDYLLLPQFYRSFMVMDVLWSQSVNMTYNAIINPCIGIWLMWGPNPHLSTCQCIFFVFVSLLLLLFSLPTKGHSNLKSTWTVVLKCISMVELLSWWMVHEEYFLSSFHYCKLYRLCEVQKWNALIKLKIKVILYCDFVCSSRTLKALWDIESSFAVHIGFSTAACTNWFPSLCRNDK